MTVPGLDLNTLLCTSSDAATLLGVKRAVLSNYKKRHADFPAPAFTDSSGNVTLYWIEEIVAWGNARKAGKVHAAIAAAEELERKSEELREKAEALRAEVSELTDPKATS